MELIWQGDLAVYRAAQAGLRVDVNGFSPAEPDIFERFDFIAQSQSLVRG
jgi:hypothetical protein